MTSTDQNSTALQVIEQTPAHFDWTNREQLDLLKEQVNPDLSDQQFALFVQVAKHSGLDPFRRQIYGVVRKGKLNIQTGIDGYRAIAARTGLYAGQDDAVFRGLSADKQYPGEATVTVYKIVGGVRCPFTATARWDEYKPKEQDWMWRQMPHNQLGKCAEALALRKAFPEETAGIDAEDAYVDVDARTVAPQERDQTREEALAARFSVLPVASKVAYTAWTKAAGLPAPGKRTDEDLDIMEAEMEQLENQAAQTDAEQAAGTERCAQCDATAVKDGLCTEHQLPPAEDA